ncbi:MAG: oligosaccharide flippase family protein [Deltaproteobacteria bacterium]|nr:oligosaccharide flippase family protein [Deltaproteobacteria bacterium]
MSSDTSIPAATSSPASATPKKNDAAAVAGRGALFIGGAKVAFMIAGFLQRWLLARVVGAAEYGAFSVVNGAISTVNNTMVQGTTQGVCKYAAEDDARAGAVAAAGLRLQMFVGTAVGLLFLLAAPWLARALGAPSYYVPWFRIVAAIPFLYGFYAVYVGLANGLRRFATQAGFDVLFSSLKTVLLLGGALAFGKAFASRTAPVTGAFVGFVATAVIVLLVAARVMGRVKAAPGVTFPIKRLASFMTGVAIYAALVNLALNYDLFWLRRFAGAAVTAARADAIVGNYEAVRNLALLPYQALIVVTFVVFPLVSRVTFEQDRGATVAYVRQTMRIAFVFSAGMGLALGCRPSALLGLLYKPEYLEGTAALPILAAGLCSLALLGVACAIINAAGSPRVAVLLVSVTLIVGSGSALVMVPHAEAGAAMLRAQALATALGMGAGFLASIVYLIRRFGAAVPVATAARTALALAVGVGVAQVMPGQGRLMGLICVAAAMLAFAATLVLARELGPQDRKKLDRLIRRKRSAS